jgi:hypothetical protein
VVTAQTPWTYELWDCDLRLGRFDCEPTGKSEHLVLDAITGLGAKLGRFREVSKMSVFVYREVVHVEPLQEPTRKPHLDAPKLSERSTAAGFELWRAVDAFLGRWPRDYGTLVGRRSKGPFLIGTWRLPQDALARGVSRCLGQAGGRQVGAAARG